MMIGQIWYRSHTLLFAVCPLTLSLLLVSMCESQRQPKAQMWTNTTLWLRERERESQQRAQLAKREPRKLAHVNRLVSTLSIDGVFI